MRSSIHKVKGSNFGVTEYIKPSQNDSKELKLSNKLECNMHFHGEKKLNSTPFLCIHIFGL